MFTGIIQAVGHIERIEALESDVKLTINTQNLPLNDVVAGDSIAVNGVCLTVAKLAPSHFEAHVSAATLSVTCGLDDLHPVNLEKALQLGDRLGGHLVSGHVDGTGQVVEFKPQGDCHLLTVRAPHALAKYIAYKGSICINGVSLTINSVKSDEFSINLIPHTLQHTTLNALAEGAQVNLEVDQIARYVERLQSWQQESR